MGLVFKHGKENNVQIITKIKIKLSYGDTMKVVVVYQFKGQCNQLRRIKQTCRNEESYIWLHFVNDYHYVRFFIFFPIIHRIFISVIL